MSIHAVETKHEATFYCNLVLFLIAKFYMIFLQIFLYQSSFTVFSIKNCLLTKGQCNKLFVFYLSSLFSLRWEKSSEKHHIYNKDFQ